MHKMIPLLAILGTLTACGRYAAPPMASFPVSPLRAFALKAPGDLVEVPGFRSGDRLKIDGPLWYDGPGQIHSLLPDSFKVELKVGSYHTALETTRLDSRKARLVTTDMGTGVAETTEATYSRTGNVTRFDIVAGVAGLNVGPYQDIKGFTIDGKRPGYFEILIQQSNGSVKLKVTKE